MTLEEFRLILKLKKSEEALTMEQLGEFMGVTRVRASEVYHGHVEPSADILKKFGLQYERTIVPIPKPRKRKA